MPTDYLSGDFKNELIKESSSVCAVDLLEINDPDLAEPIRLVNNVEDFWSNGFLFRACKFQITSPSEGSDPGQISCLIEDIGQEVFRALETLPPTHAFEFPQVIRMVCTDAEPDHIQVLDVFDLEEHAVDEDTGYVGLTLGYGHYLREVFPAHSIRPDTHRAAFTTNL